MLPAGAAAVCPYGEKASDPGQTLAAVARVLLGAISRHLSDRCYYSTLIGVHYCTPIEKREANLFFNMISELYEKVSVIVTSNKSFETWAEMMGDSVMTTALLDRLLHHARVFTLDGESYRIKKSRKEV